jgi:ligand-binding sensor domain-containing protein
MRHSLWLAFLLAFCLALTACQPIQSIDLESATPGVEQKHTEATPVHEGALGPAAAEFPKLHSEWTSYTTGNPIRSLVVQGDIIWTGGDGVERWDMRNGDFAKLTTKQGLVDNHVTAMAVGRDGAIWFGTWGSGLSRLSKDGTWTTYTMVDGLADHYILAIAEGPDGSMWIGTFGGVSRLREDGSWTTYTTADGLAHPDVLAIAAGPDGSMWFGTAVGGVSRLREDGTWTTYTTADGLSSDGISSIGVGLDGSIWFGGIGVLGGYYAVPSGVSRLGPDGGWTTYTTTDGLASDYVGAIAAGPDGSIWFSTFIETRPVLGNGVSRLRVDATWTTYTAADGLASDTIHAIAVGPDGAIWFGGANGLSRLHEDGT